MISFLVLFVSLMSSVIVGIFVFRNKIFKIILIIEHDSTTCTQPC